MITADNSENAVKLRRYKSELYTTGMGYVLFGLWSVVKVIMSAFFDELSFSKVIEAGDIAIEDIPAVQVIYLMVIVASVIVLLVIHLYVGIGAMKSSRGSQKKRYLTWAKIFLVINILLLTLYFANLKDLSHFEFNDTQLASFIVDLTVTLILFGIVRSNHMIKKLTA